MSTLFINENLKKSNLVILIKNINLSEQGYLLLKENVTDGVNVVSAPA